jgi:hypothetical protein
MITPSFGLTATERVLPRLALDFTTASLDSRVTFTRAANTATVVDSTGAVVLVNADLPRFDHTIAVGGACKGLLIEEARTNLVLNSVFSGAVAGTPGTAPTGWTIGFGTAAMTNVSAGYYAAGNRIRIVANSQRLYLSRSSVVVIGTTYSYSAKINVISGSNIFINIFNFGGGVTADAFFIDGVAATSTTVITPGLKTLTLVKLAAGLSLEARIGLGVGQNVTGTVDIEMPQIEAGAFPTSYIPTEAVAVTRNADVATMTGTNFSDWFNATEGTFVFEFTTDGAANRYYYQISTAVETNSMYGYTGGTFTRPVYVLIGGSLTVSLISATVASNTPIRLSASYKENDFGSAENGTALRTDTSSAVPAVDRLSIGSRFNGLQQINGHMRQFFYYPQRITNAELLAFSKQG